MRHKAINNDGIISAHAQCVALVCKRLSFERNIKDSTIAHSTPYFEFFFSVQLILNRESSENGRFLLYDQTIGEKLGEKH